MTFTAIDIGAWAADEDHPVHPIGSKPKRTVIAPADASAPLIPGHSYLFKTATGWQAQQVWSEVIAYEVGDMLGLPVPRCMIAKRGDETGALIEFFYGYPNEQTVARLVHGSDILTSMYPQAKQRGRPHAVRLNVGICRRFAPRDDALQWWARVITFDALIGNTDRHTENWGLLTRVERKQQGPIKVPRVRINIAPAYDNGTSLGYEQSEQAIASPWDQSRLVSYANKGRHHLSWDLDDDSVRGHIELCKRYAAAYPAARNAMQNVIRFERGQITSIVERFIGADVGIPFSSARAGFVTDLIETRQGLLRAALGESDDKLD